MPASIIRRLGLRAAEARPQQRRWVALKALPLRALDHDLFGAPDLWTPHWETLVVGLKVVLSGLATGYVCELQRPHCEDLMEEKQVTQSVYLMSSGISSQREPYTSWTQECFQPVHCSSKTI